LFGPGFEVVPASVVCHEILVNSVVPSILHGGGVWGPLEGPFEPGAFKATLLDFFDWLPLDYIDIRYYVVIIDDFPAHPTKVGQHALIETTFARVYWRDESVPAGAA
jgi:hypothetical protein